MTLKKLIEKERMATREAFNCLNVYGKNDLTIQAEAKMQEACARTDAAIEKADPKIMLQLDMQQLDLIGDGLLELQKQMPVTSAAAKVLLEDILAQVKMQVHRWRLL